jgi:hypothetical protein
MKVNLLQGTYTPTLTPMPGVHNALQRTRPLLRFRANANGHGWGLAAEGWGVTATRGRKLYY